MSGREFWLPPSVAERLRVFYDRPSAAPATRNREDAFEQLCAVLTAVEDEMSGVPFNPDTWMTDGRLYPPQADSRHQVPNRLDVVRYRTRRHNVFVRDNGAIEIREITGTVVFAKAGADGQGVDL